MRRITGYFPQADTRNPFGYYKEITLNFQTKQLRLQQSYKKSCYGFCFNFFLRENRIVSWFWFLYCIISMFLRRIALDRKKLG